MPGLSRVSRRFVEEYAEQHQGFRLAAEQASRFVEDVVTDLPIAIHGVTARAKTVGSLRGKLRHKRYSNPRIEVTDLIGLRVITYFARDIDVVATELRARLDVSRRRSRDVRNELDENEFGYRSVHLISRLRPGDAAQPSVSSLRRRWFEIQVRSILEHAWSEIEHEVVYKSGVEYPREVRRRFMAVAGSLEVLEDAFSTLTSEKERLIDQYKRQFQAGAANNQRFDCARLCAYLETVRPEGVSWRVVEREQAKVAPGLATAALDALEMANLSRPHLLAQVIGTNRFRRAVVDFAAIEGIAPATTSHVAVVVFAVACVAPSLLKVHFPEMLFCIASP